MKKYINNYVYIWILREDWYKGRNGGKGKDFM